MRHLIIDGLNFFIRSFTVNPSMDTNGNHIGGTIGFLLSLNKLVRETKPDLITIVWDGEGGSVKRRSLFKDYKAGRKPKLNRQYDFGDADDQMRSFAEQIGKLNKYLDMLPVRTIRIKGVEADDVIAYMWGFVLDKQDEKVIVSSDKDFYQLLDQNTTIYVPTKKKYVCSQDIVDTIGCLPENYIYIKALCGDRSDNIKGIRGIGEKTAIKLFPFLGERQVELDELFKYAEAAGDKKAKYDSVIANREIVITNVRLMQLSSPLMNPMAAKSIREHVNEDSFSYRQSDVRMQLIRDGLQIKASDFFSVFKEQRNRSNKTFG